jgi:predicted ATPase
VLDNCEHLIEACAVLAQKLLQASPVWKILVPAGSISITGGAWYVPNLSV